MNDPKAITYFSWNLDLADLVEDESEQAAVMYCVLKYQWSLFGANCEIGEPQTEAGKRALKILKRKADMQLEKAKSIQNGKLSNLEKANAAKAAKRGGTPSACESVCEQARANPYAHTDSEPNRNTPSASAHAYGVECNRSAAADTNTNTYTNIPQTPFAGGLESDGFLLGLDLLDNGYAIDTAELSRAWNKAKEVQAAGTLRKDKRAYVAGFLRTKLPDPTKGHAIANMIKACCFRSWPVLEITDLSVLNEVLTITCSEKAFRSIEAEADKHKAEIQKYLQGIGAKDVKYNTP